MAGSRNKTDDKDQVEKNRDGNVQTEPLPIIIQKKARQILEQLEIPADSNGMETLQKELRIFPVNQVVIFPNSVIPLSENREWDTETLDRLTRIGGTVGVVARKTLPRKKKSSNATEVPQGSSPYYDVGTEIKILKMVRLPDQGGNGLIVQGLRRFRVLEWKNTSPKKTVAVVEYFQESETKNQKLDVETTALGKALKELVRQAIALSPQIPSEFALFVESVQEYAQLIELILPYLSVDFAQKQELLEIEDFGERLKKVHVLLAKELQMLELSQKINDDVKNEVGKQQKKFFLREQIRFFQKELNELEGIPSGVAGKGSSTSSDPLDLHQRVTASLMSQEAKDVAYKELEKMSQMQPASPEYTVSHTYVQWLLDLPWGVSSQSEIRIDESQKILNAEHYGLEKIKQRILEHLAVCALKSDLKGPILLFVGPPGVGKTSLGKSIAESLGRKFARISLGGVRDEAEIRGHRRTYIGSMPGKIIDAIKKLGTQDPVILLDEIDKLANDGRGDPASALLEALDPEQNANFVDHYLNVPFDLSQVFFIATANQLQTIPGPLLDRMETIELSSYTQDEKAHIGQKYLLPQVLRETGLSDKVNLSIDSKAFHSIVDHYTREAGVRQLKRELAKLARKIALDIATDSVKMKALKQAAAVKKKPAKTAKQKIQIKEKQVADFLGPQKFLDKKKKKKLPVGVSTGLAWTPVGGDVLFIEVAAVKEGTGKLILTGQLGDVMKESVQTALTYLRAHGDSLGTSLKDFSKSDLHMHFPEGAVKKDGPSAGIASFAALSSLFLKKPLSSNLAMTGEISLRGDVLPVGGIKEKVLAAHRLGLTQIILPLDNKKDLLEDIPKNILKDLEISFVDHLEQVMKILFVKKG